jgi:DNA-binding MarR family transcriptional regulator
LPHESKLTLPKEFLAFFNTAGIFCVPKFCVQNSGDAGIVINRDNNSNDISRIVNSVRRIRNAINCYSKELMKTVGLSGPQLGLLIVVKRHPQVSLGEVSEKMFLHASTVSGIVDRLEAAGYLARRRDSEDRRTVHLRLTDKGNTAVAQAPPSAFGFLIEGLGRLPKEQLHEINQSMQTLCRLMKIEDGDGDKTQDVEVCDHEQRDVDLERES